MRLDPASRLPSTKFACRLMVLGGAAAAFLILASSFEPRRSTAEGPLPARPATNRSAPVLLGSHQPPHSAGWPSLGQLEGREYRVLVYASPDGPRYTVCALDGRVLQADLPDDDVYRAFPTLDLKGLRTDPPETVGDGPTPVMIADPKD